MNESVVQQPSDFRPNTPEHESRESATPSQGSGSMALLSQEDMDDLFGLNYDD